MIASPSDMAPADAADRVLDRLERLSAAQAAALAAGDDDRLLAVLAEKQDVLDAADLPTLVRAAGPSRAAGLTTRVEALLTADGESLIAATARRDELAGELSSLGSATAARGAYGAAAAPPPGRSRLNIAG